MQTGTPHVVRRLDLTPPLLLAPRDRRYCGAMIDPGRVQIRNRHPRARAHEALGLRFDQCGSPAAYEIDGDALCEHHAASRALEILTDGI